MPDKKNRNLTNAKKQKKDEFYTQLTDIEKELVHYKDFLRGKIVFCNCDDPKWSNFWRYFHLNFSHIGLKKLIATHYDAEKATYKLEYEGGDDSNVEAGEETPLKQNGDFRSQECIELLQEADVVITNPPFSLFREYVAQLIQYNKKFIIIGNQNAVTYKDIFPLIKDNKIWYGFGFKGGTTHFISSYDNYATASDKKEGMIRVSGVVWFTNVDHDKRHEPLTLFRRYYDDPSLYPHYDNYDAINVDKTADIPCDYFEAMGVPITFLDKYCPDQFEILGLGNGRSNFTPTKDYIDPIMHKKDGKTGDGDAINRVLAINYPTPPHVSTTQRQTQDICSHHTHGSSSGGSTRSIVLRLSDGSVKILCNALTPFALKRVLVNEYGYQESELTYCSGEIGVPITFLDKYSPEQFNIVGADFELAERMPLPDGKVGTGRFYHSGGAASTFVFQARHQANNTKYLCKVIFAGFDWEVIAKKN